MTYRPLADEIRPETLDEVVGQKHILGEGGLLRRIIEGGSIPNLIFYGPSGTGSPSARTEPYAGSTPPPPVSPT